MKIDLIEALNKYLSAFNISFRHIDVTCIEETDPDYGLRKFLNPSFDWGKELELLYNQLEDNELFYFEDGLGITYGLFRSYLSKECFYLIGPFQNKIDSPKNKEWITQQFGKELVPIIKDYYTCIPIIDKTMLLNGIHAIISLAFQKEPLRIKKIQDISFQNLQMDSKILQESGYDNETMATMLEMRYQAENAFIDAVAIGDETGACRAHNIFKSYYLGSRFNGSLRGKKNGLIVLNTLLRKALERSNVHPYYIDELSMKYSLEIEAITNETICDNMGEDMLRGYCQCVREHSLKQYSPMLQKVINHINLNLQSPLSLKYLSTMFHVSSCYLSNTFKQETGQTLTEYINHQRINRAAISLCNGKGNVASIAASVGILDVNYFTKLFKRIMGITPTQYRQNKGVQEKQLWGVTAN